MLTRIIKTWEFNNAERPDIFLSPGARLNAENEMAPRLQLLANPLYPTTTDIYVKTKKYQPNSVLKWLMFEPIWDTSEPGFVEYTIMLANKSGSQFNFDALAAIPRVGDVIYQGDSRTAIESIADGVLTLADGSEFQDGSAYALRSVCDVLFRIYDANDDAWFYNLATSSWEQVTGDGDWNTMFVLSNHLNELSLKEFGKAIGFYINLRTSDQQYTPHVYYLQLLGSFDIEFTEDIIFDSLIPLIEQNIIVTTQVNVNLTSETNVIDLANEYVMESMGYNITDVEVAYNVTQDPTRTENIAASYELGEPKERNGYKPGKVNLSAIQSAGDRIEIKLKYYPEISVNTTNEYYEVARTPMLVFEHISKKSAVASPNANLGRNYIRDKLTLTGIKENNPEQYDLIFEYAVFTGNQTDQHRLGEALHRFFNTQMKVTSWGLDEPYPMIVGSIFRSENIPNAADVNTHVGQFKIVNVIEVVRDPENLPLVDYLNSSMTTN